MPQFTKASTFCAFMSHPVSIKILGVDFQSKLGTQQASNLRRASKQFQCGTSLGVQREMRNLNW
jgi:hypothetical protein